LSPDILTQFSEKTEAKTTLPIDGEKKIEEQKGFTFRRIEIGEYLSKQMIECPPIHSKNSDVCYQAMKFDKDLFRIDRLPSIGFGTPLYVMLIDGKVEYIKMSFLEINSANLLEMLISKYGKFNSYSTSEVQNRMGAKFGKFEAKWIINNCEIYLTNISGDIESGLLMITSEAYRKTILEKRKEEIEDAKDKL
jgi:hypothetical protein